MSEPITIESNAVVVREENPGALMRKATDVAGVCREIVLRTASHIQGKKFVKVEGWEAIATAHGCVAGASDAERAYDKDGNWIGYTAKGYVRNARGEIISTGDGFVGFDEKDRKGNATWKNRAEYAGRAMAQTRSISRACRSAFAHVVVLIDANLSTTPAEEVPFDGFSDAQGATHEPMGSSTTTQAYQTSPRAISAPPQATPTKEDKAQKCKDRFLQIANEQCWGVYVWKVACDLGWIMDNEKLADASPDRFPTTSEEFRKVEQLVKAEQEKAAQNDGISQELAEKYDSIHAPVGEPKEEPTIGPAHYDAPTAPWRSFPLPWGKQAGTQLAKVSKNYLFGLWANFKVETEYNGKPKSPETIAKDTIFRAMLDEAGKHFGFTKKD